MPDWNEIEHHRIKVEYDDINTYTAFFDDIKAGELSLFEDHKERQWLNNVSSTHQSVGIGLSLLIAAVETHGAIYAATDGFQSFQEVNDDDTRHLSIEGAALVNSALRNGILLQEWCFNPAIENDYDLENDF